MDLVASYKEKLAHFRIKELKDILTQLGLSKQGKKQDLADRILAILSDERVSGMWAKKNAVGKEEVAKVVDDIYRKMQVSGATDLASKCQGVSDITNSTKFKGVPNITNNTKFKEEDEDTYQMEKTRCPCGSSLHADSMIKCEDRRCNVWQHIDCVIIPETPMEGLLPIPPSIFYCELCRLGRADPFLVIVANPLYPVKLTIASLPTDGTSPVQNVEKTFQLTRAHRDLLVKPEYDIQAWCMLLNDKVPFRMQWPQYADLQVNGLPVRVINRPDSQLLGANGRDDGPVITPCTRDGINKISLTGCDARVFCLGVRIAKRQTVQQILNLIPKESDGEPFEDALARVRRCVGGGNAAENADSDSDLEIVADCIPVNLRCPLSGSRMKIAGRFKHCAHMGCFDLEVFVEMNQRSRKWQCPICLKNYSLENLIIDPYFTRITTKMQNCGEDLTEIEVKPDGSWLVKADNDHKSLGDLGQWHLPDGTLCVPMEVESKPKPDVLKQVKQEVAAEGRTSLKLGIKKNRNGVWEVSKPENPHSLSSGNNLVETFGNSGHNIIPMRSSVTGSGRDGEDPSVNQDGGGQFDYSTTTVAEFDSLSLNVEPSCGFIDQNPSTVGDAEVVVLSDTEEETENLISSGPVYNNSRTNAEGVAFSDFPNGISEPHFEDPALVGGGSSCLGLFNTNDDDFEVPFWSLPTASHGGPSFQLFGSDVDPTGALVDVHHDSFSCPLSMDHYTLTAETAMGSAALVPKPLHHQSITDMHDGLIDNPLDYGIDDPSLQLFLPTRPSETEQAELRDQVTVSNGLRSDDWISLRLGGDGGGVHCESVTANGSNLRQQPPSKDGAFDSANAASLLHGLSDGKSAKTNRERSDNPFSFPRQKRSVRPRLYFSMESDSEEDR